MLLSGSELVQEVRWVELRHKAPQNFTSKCYEKINVVEKTYYGERSILNSESATQATNTLNTWKGLSEER